MYEPEHSHFSYFKLLSCFARYVVCKGLRENSQAVHEFMFNVNVRINKLKNEDAHDVVEVGEKDDSMSVPVL